MSTAFETGSYVGGLTITIPGDNGANGKRSNGAAEIRKFKEIVKDSFPSVTAAVTASHTELNYSDITTLGTAEASKVVTADGSANIDASAITWTDLGAVTLATIGTGVTGVTQSAGDDSTKLATTAYVDTTAQSRKRLIHVYRGSTNQSISSSTWTKVQLNTEVSDADALFDSSTNYRFTPDVGGWYQVNAHLDNRVTSGSIGQATMSIAKNGDGGTSADAILGNNVYNESDGAQTNLSGLVHLNGSTDYIELWVFIDGTGPAVAFDSNATGRASFLSAVLVKAD